MDCTERLVSNESLAKSKSRAVEFIDLVGPINYPVST